MPALPLAASELIPVFDRHGVLFIVVGAVAAVAAGAPILTKDVDLLIDLETAASADSSLAWLLEHHIAKGDKYLNENVVQVCVRHQIGRAHV